MTLLAFFYLPLNLTTSIFGMNLQQLNDNGLDIWVFITTAIIALMLTMAVWTCISQASDYKLWRKQMRDGEMRVGGSNDYIPWPKRGKAYSVVIRTAILIMLLWEGHGRWVCITGAWLRILTNERFSAWQPPNTGDAGEAPGIPRGEAETSDSSPYVRGFLEWTACDICLRVFERNWA